MQNFRGCPPSLALGSPVFWAPLVAGLLMRATRPLFWFCGGTPPRPPPWGLRPPGPPFPTLAGLGFASVLGPTRGGVTGVGNSPLFKVLWGDTPHALCQGASPPWTPHLPTPRWLWVWPAFWVPLVAGLLMRATRPLFWFCGGTPPTPPARGLAPWTPVFPPPLAWCSPAFWVPLVAGLLMRATRPLFWFCGRTPPTTPARGLAPPGPHLSTLVG